MPARGVGEEERREREDERCDGRAPERARPVQCEDGDSGDDPGSEKGAEEGWVRSVTTDARRIVDQLPTPERPRGVVLDDPEDGDQRNAQEHRGGEAVRREAPRGPNAQT